VGSPDQLVSVACPSRTRKDGADRLYGESIPVEIDDDVRVEYWTQIRGDPARATEAIANR
jgi:hypothetical protein